MKVREALENWIYGILGFEERTFIVSRRLASDVLNNNIANLKSTYTDYTEMMEYTFDLKITKKPLNQDIKMKIQAETDEGVIGKLLKQYDCSYTGECDYKKKQKLK